MVLALVLVPSLGYTQAANNASDQTISYTVTNFANVGVTGLAVAGNPGYLVMRGVRDDTAIISDYYLWVDETGDLCMASYSTINTISGFPNGDWENVSCTKVGSQS